MPGSSSCEDPNLSLLKE